MKTKATLLIFVAWVSHGPATRGQGTFQNLNFESANVSGYVPGPIPITDAMPGWAVTSPAFTPVFYDDVSLGGAAVTTGDSHFAHLPGFSPLHGQFSALLFGGEFGPATISQTGMVPGYSRSLQMDIGTTLPDLYFSVSLGGREIQMLPLMSFATYTVYGGDITTFAGQLETLSLSALTPPRPIIPPSMFLVDNIVFSPQIVPEPTAMGLFALGSLLLLLEFCLYFQGKSSYG